MATPIFRFLPLALLLTSFFWGVSCGRKCQQSDPTPLKTITGTEWRLIRTSNPQMSEEVNNYTFIIMQFRTDFEGSVFRVINNKRYDNPVFVFDYNVESRGRNGYLRVEYSTVPSGDPNTDAATTSPSTEKFPGDYEYVLSSKLTLTETNTGYTYEFVHFLGIVDPDNNCTF